MHWYLWTCCYPTERLSLNCILMFQHFDCCLLVFSLLMSLLMYVWLSWCVNSPYNYDLVSRIYQKISWYSNNAIMDLCYFKFSLAIYSLQAFDTIAYNTNSIPTVKKRDVRWSWTLQHCKNLIVNIVNTTQISLESHVWKETFSLSGGSRIFQRGFHFGSL